MKQRPLVELVLLASVCAIVCAAYQDVAVRAALTRPFQKRHGTGSVGYLCTDTTGDGFGERFLHSSAAPFPD